MRYIVELERLDNITYRKEVTVWAENEKDAETTALRVANRNDTWDEVKREIVDITPVSIRIDSDETDHSAAR